MPGKNQEKTRLPQWFILKAVAVPILLGTFLLMTPAASRSGAWTDPLTALFMATSATCVTGHTVVDPGGFFSLFGQLILLGLVQIGGLGFMTLAMVCLVLLGRRLTIQSEQSLTASLGVDQVVRLKRLLVRTVIVSLAFELAGAAVLAVRFWGAPGVGSAGRAVYAGLFHAVSAFCNAGLSLFPDSLVQFRSDPVVLGAVSALIVLGGLGFLVINELPGYFNRRRKGRLPLHVRITVLTTLVLLAAGWALTALLEWKTTLAALAWPDRLSCALFHSVSSRTAGFSVVEMAESGHASRFVTMILMFIGGSPGSAAGGIKTTTAAVLFFTMLSMVRGRRETVFRDRTLTYRVVKEALSVFLLSLGAVGILYGLLLVSEAAALSAARFSASALLFDTVSAFGTVGLSAGVPPALTDPGKLIMIATMYIGRVGPLTMALIVGLKDTRQRVQYPEEDIIIG